MKTGLLAILCLAIFCTPMTVEGQQDRRILAAKQRVEQYLTQQKQNSENRLATVVDEIHRVCDLDDSQLKKLRFAAKGAVSKYIAKIEKQQNDMYRRQFGEAWDRDDEEDNKKADDENAALNRQVMVERVFATSIYSSYPVENEKIWKDNFAKVLTSEQTAKYKAAMAERQKFQRSAAVHSFIARIDKQLLLTTQQRDTITKLIDEKFGDKIALQGNRMGFVVNRRGGWENNDPPIKHELLGLSKNQLVVWKSTVEPQLRNLRNIVIRGANLGGGGMGGVLAAPINILPARPPIRIDPKVVKEKRVEDLKKKIEKMNAEKEKKAQEGKKVPKDKK